MKYVWISVTAFFIVATLLPLVRHDRWWIRIFDFPRAQIAAGGILTAALAVFRWERSSVWETAIFFALLAAVAFQAYQMIPFTRLAPVEVRGTAKHNPESTVKILIANVLISNADVKSFLGLVRQKDPDVILAVECDDWWERQLAPLESRYPCTIKEPRDNTYGMLVYSRLEFVDARMEHLRKAHIPSAHAVVRLRCGRTFLFFGLHPEPPYPRYADDTTQRDAELLEVARTVRERGEPTVVAGDLNDVAWSYTTRLFRKISGLLDPRIGRTPMCTFPVKYPLVQFPLDHVFTSDDFRLVSLEKLPDIGSDHYPVFVHLEYDRRAEDVHEEPEPDSSEKQQAQEKLEKADRQNARSE